MVFVSPSHTPCIWYTIGGRGLFPLVARGLPVCLCLHPYPSPPAAFLFLLSSSFHPGAADSRSRRPKPCRSHGFLFLPCRSLKFLS
eukprot:14648_6